MDVVLVHDVWQLYRGARLLVAPRCQNSALRELFARPPSAFREPTSTTQLLNLWTPRKLKVRRIRPLLFSPYAPFWCAVELGAASLVTMQAWWPLVLAAQQRRMGGGLIHDRQQAEVEPDWLMRTVQEYWIGPCSAKLPDIMHGAPCVTIATI